MKPVTMKFLCAVVAAMLSACSPQQANLTYWVDSDLAGVDADHNGIRDDVDAWINSQPYDLKEKRAMQVELFYNQTKGLIPDLLEAADQRLAEILPTNKPTNYSFYNFINNTLSAESGSEIKAAANKLAMDKLRLIRRAISQ